MSLAISAWSCAPSCSALRCSASAEFFLRCVGRSASMSWWHTGHSMKSDCSAESSSEPGGASYRIITSDMLASAL